MKTLTTAIAILVLNFASVLAETLPIYFGTSTSKKGESKGIYAALFDTDKGKFTGKVELAAEIDGPGFLDLHPNGKFLYAVCQTPDGKGPGVAAYAGDGTKLKFINAHPIGDGGGAHVAVHPAGKMLMTAHYGGGSVAVFPINSDGSVGERSQLIEHEGGSKVVGKRQDSPHPHYVGYDAAGNFAFVPDLGMDSVVIYKVNAGKTGIEPHGIAASIPGGGPRHMKFSTNKKFVYLLNELALSITTFSYNSKKGTLKKLTTEPALSEEIKKKELFNSSSEIRVHPSGKFVYSANRGNDTITAYRADPATGKLTVIEVEPIRGAWPRNFNLDPSGKCLLVAGQNSSTISVFAIDQKSGELAFQTRSIIKVPTSICVLFGKQHLK